MRPLRNDIAAFEEKTSDLVHQRGTVSDELITNAVQRLHIELLLGLQLHKPHRRASCRFRDRLGIAIIVLLRLDVRTDILRRHQPHRMALSCQRPAHVMSAAASLHRHDASRQARRIGDDGLAPHPPSHNDLARGIQPDHAAAVLAQINPENRYFHDLLLPQTNRCHRITTVRIRGEPSIKGGLGSWYRPHERRTQHQAPCPLRRARTSLRPAPDARNVHDCKVAQLCIEAMPPAAKLVADK